MIGTLAKRLFGSANDRVIKSLRKTVDAINALEPELEAARATPSCAPAPIASASA